MPQPGAPRLPVTDHKARLSWREMCHRGVSSTGRTWLLLSVVLFYGFFRISMDMLPTSTLQPHLDSSGAFFIWVILSIASTALTVIMITFIARKLRGALNKN